MLIHAVAQSFGNPLFLMEIFMNAKPQVVDSEKAKALQAALAQIEKQFGKGTIMRLGEGEVIDDIQVVSTGSLGLDIALGVGGLPRAFLPILLREFIDRSSAQAAGPAIASMLTCIFMATVLALRPQGLFPVKNK